MVQENLFLKTRVRELTLYLPLPSGSLGNLRTILSKVQIAVCSECKTETEVNPATLSDFTFTKSGKDERHTLDEQKKNVKEKVEKAFNSVLSDVCTEAETAPKIGLVAHFNLSLVAHFIFGLSARFNFGLIA